METKINVMKLLLATVVAGVVLFAVGGIWHSALFADYYNQKGATDSMMGGTKPNLGALAVASLLEGFVLSWFYMMAYPNGSTFMDSVLFGVMTAVIGFSLWGLTSFAVIKTPDNWLMMEGGFSLAQGILTGFGIMIVTGKKAMAMA